VTVVGLCGVVDPVSLVLIALLILVVLVRT
jgi:hypothetical protein